MAHEQLERHLRALVKFGGSDLHVKAGSPPRVRVDGALRKLPNEPVLTTELTADMAMSIMHSDVFAEFERRSEADFAYMAGPMGRFRVNVFRQRGSVAMILRRVLASAPSFGELGLPEVVARLAGEPRGLVVVCGPAGSGKTTTLAAMVDWINRNREVHIVTIEDPIEVVHEDRLASINQREIGFDTADFPTALRSAMRQDPDVILVGEMRDAETVAAALSAAETGHLVLSTLHTIDAAESVNRIVDFFPPHQHPQVRVTLAGSLRGTVCQRLVPVVNGAGRVAAVEAMVVTGRIQQCILDPNHTGQIHDIVAEGEFYGMQTFDQALVKLYEQSLIDMRSAMQCATNPHDLRLLLQAKGLAPAAN